VNHVQSKIETLESQKEELEDSMNASDHQTMVRREIDKIKEEWKPWKEKSTTDTHKVIYEAEKRVAKMSKKDIYKYDKEKEQTESEKMQEELEPLPLCPMADD
jgi:ATP sulfurylase